jgi:L-lactate dehydrogenase complex protein LldG
LEEAIMNERDAIFARIKEALCKPAPRPGTHGNGHPGAVTAKPEQDIPRWLPAVGGTFEAWIAAFQAAAVELRADFCLLNNPQEMLESLAKLRDAEGWKRAASHSGALTDAACASLNLPVLLTDQPYDVNELEKCDVGISECDALIAQTGSVLVTSKSAGGRALSVLPPHHVVLARREQLLPDLPSAFALIQKKFGPNYPSMISFITGPSRTGDIERILVLGAHGPKKLTIFCY